MTDSERDRKLTELKRRLLKVSKTANAISIRSDNFAQRMRELRDNIEIARFCLYELQK